jgi:hypothetical protein
LFTVSFAFCKTIVRKAVVTAAQCRADDRPGRVMTTGLRQVIFV